MKLSKKIQILEALEKITQHKRYDEVKVDDIASAAGVGKGTVYRYFSSKEHLYFELSKYGLESFHSRVEALYKQPEITPISFLKSFIAIFADFGQKRTRNIESIREIEEWNKEEFAELKLKVMDYKYKIDAMLIDMIAKGQQEKKIDSYLSAEKLTQFTIHSVLSLHHYRREHTISITELEYLILKGLGCNE